jgi:hypothetical protein
MYGPRPYVLKESGRQHVKDVARAAARNDTMADRVMCFSMYRHSVQHVEENRQTGHLKNVQNVKFGNYLFESK